MDPAEFTYQYGEATMVCSDFAGPAGRTFVLVHGIGMGRIVFTEVAQRLAAHGRVLVPDLPGFGDSPEPGTAASIEETSELIANFIVSEGSQNVTLIGHSMGTQVVAEVARNHAQLIDTLVLIAPTINRHERRASRQTLRMLQDLYGESPKVLLRGLQEYIKTSPLWFANKLRLMLNHRLEEVCPEINTPTLVLRGETDRVCPRGWVREIAEALPCSEMHEIPDRGHEAIIKSPEPVASMTLEFVKAHTSGIGHLAAG